MKRLLGCATALLLAGCFTLHQSEPVSVDMVHASPGRDIKLALSGFAATVTEYVPVYGSETVYVTGRHGHYGRRRGWWGGHYVTSTSETLLPQVRQSEVFLERARSRFEENGFLLRASPADYTVDVTFAGPFVTSGERTAQAAWMLLSALSADYAVQTWTAKLRIYDNRTGRLVFHREASQKYQFVAWSPLFFLGLAGCTENTYNYMQSWCLTALTDRMVADAGAFLVQQPVVPAATEQKKDAGN